MKKISFCFLVGLLVTGNYLLAEEVAERILSLPDCLYYAQRNNSDILNAQQEVTLAQQRLREAKSQLYPRIDLMAAASRYETGNFLSLPPVLSEINSFWIFSNRYPGQEYFIRLALWQPVYTSGRIKTNLTLARTKLSQSESELEIIRNQIFFQIKSAYYQILAAQKQVQLNEEEAKLILALRQRPEAKNPAVSQELDKYQSEVNRVLINIRYDLEEKKISLLKLLGLELNTQFSLKGELSEQTTDYNLNILLANAYRNRPELQQTQFAQTVDQLQLNMAFAQRFPTVVLSGSYDFLGADFPLPDKSWSANLLITLPLFDGGAIFARIAQQQTSIRQGKIKKVRLEDLIAAQVRQAYLAYRKNCQLLDLNRREKEQLVEVKLPTAVDTLGFLNYLNYRRAFRRIEDNYYQSLAELAISQSYLFSVVNLNEKNN